MTNADAKHDLDGPRFREPLSHATMWPPYSIGTRDSRPASWGDGRSRACETTSCGAGVVTTAKATPKAWAVLAYTIAEDTASSSPLDEAAQGELEAICRAADFGRVSVAAQVDFKQRRGVYRTAITEVDEHRGFSDIDPARNKLWRTILDGVDTDAAHVRLQRDATDLNAADADVLQDFLGFGRSACPADRYVVSFFGHAAGPLGVFSDAPRGHDAHDTLRLPAMVEAFRGSGHRAAVIVFRDCFMNCLEAAYQLRGAAEFIVATQALAPATGTWPWQSFMDGLTLDASPYSAGLAVAKALAAHLDDPANRSHFDAVPYSLLDLGATEGVATRLAALVEALEAARQDPARARACGRALEASRVGAPDDRHVPGDPALLDVPTLCGRLAALRGDPVAAPAIALGREVGSRLVRWHHSQTRHHLGTSVFYKPVRPGDVKRSYLQAEDETVANDDAEHYRALALSKATGWHRIALHPLPVGD